MPSKAQRAASRQARLSRRRRRGKAAPQNFQAGPSQQAEPTDSAAASPDRSTRSAPSAGAQTSVAAAPTARSTARSRRRTSDSGASNVTRYLGRELRQIGAITSLIAVILVGLTFVLG